jgi:predicted  nucleic acid-binding Zn-ribbon protein
MEIQTEAQAAKVRAVMGAMIVKLREAKAAGDKTRVDELRDQYTTLQTALQEYKAALPEPSQTPKQILNAEKLSDLKAELRQSRQENKDLKAQLAAAEEIVKTQRTTISGLKYEMEIIKDEVRTLRAPAPTQAYRQVQNLKPAAATPNIDLDAAFNELFGEAR